MANFKIVYEATDSLLLQALKLDKTVFNKINQGEFDTCKKWLKINKDIYTFLLFGERCVGYINFIAITDECFNKFMLGEMKDYMLKDSDILPFRKGENKTLLMSVAIDKEFRDSDAIVKLQEGFMAKIRSLNEEGIFFKEMVLDCVSIDGVKYSIEQYGAHFIKNSHNGKVFYVKDIFHNPYKVPRIQFEKLSKKNIKEAALIQYKIFPYWCGYCDYLKEIDECAENASQITYIIKHQNKNVGIIGLNVLPEYPNVVWLN